MISSSIIKEFRAHRKSLLKGDQGLAGIPGPIGSKGERGAVGPQGPQGAAGAKGDTGEQGPQGERGPTGHTGLSGKDGLKGEKGDLGPMPRHESRGDAIRFELKSGEWGKWINLASGTPHAYGGGTSKQDVIALIELYGKDSNLYNKLIDTVGSYKYIGEATPGTATSEAKWRVKRIDQTDTGGDVTILFAGGNKTFTQVWDDRLTFTYSATGL